jgi:hypothetical protein
MNFDEPQKEVYLYTFKKNTTVCDCSRQIYRKNAKKSKKSTSKNVFRFFSAYTFSNAKPKVLSPGSCYILNFFLLERACQDAEHDEALFLIKLCFYYYKDIYINRPPFSENFFTPSTCHFFFT